MLLPYDWHQLVHGIILIIVGIFGLLVIYNPALGVLLFKEHYRNRASHTPQQKRLTLGLVALFIALTSFGLGLVFQFIAQIVCIEPQLLSRFEGVFFGLGFILILFSVLMSSTRGSTPPPKPFSRRQFYLSLLGFVACIGVLFYTFYWSLQTRLNHPFETLDRIAMVSPTDGWAIGNRYFTGRMYRYQNGQWQPQQIPTVHVLTDITMISSDEGWAVSDSNSMLHYKDGAWNKVLVPADELRAIDMISSEEGWAVGNHGVILHYSNNQWVEIPSPTEHTLEAIDMVSPTEGWIVGGGDYSRNPSSVILHYEQGQWVPFTNPTTVPLAAVHMQSEARGWAVGGTSFNPTRSIILEFRDGAWHEISSPTPLPLSGISMSSDSKGWAVGGGFFSIPLECEWRNRTAKLSTIIEYTDGEWHEIARPYDVALQEVAALDEQHGWMVGWNIFWQLENGEWRKAQDVP